jgi:hypothetical protein
MIADSLQVPANALKLLQKTPSVNQQKLIDNIISSKIGRGAVIAAATGAAKAEQQ